MGLFGKSKPVTVRMDESIVPDEIRKLEEEMLSRVAGQDRAVKQFIRMHETVMSGLFPIEGPIDVQLFVGPTGSGKTHIVKAFCDIMNVTLIKVDCEEYKHSHNTARLIGSPPGYIGSEIKPFITKEKIEALWKDNNPRYTVILLDEIEKAHEDFRQLLLGAFNDGYITSGKNEKIDMSKCVFVMTSNLGSGEVNKLLNNKGYGFVDNAAIRVLDDDIYEASKKAVKAFVSPEFFNRIRRMVVFRALTDDVIRLILDMELKIVQDRVLKAGQFVHVDVSSRGKDFLISEGTSKEYGARELRRAVDRLLVSKLTRALATKQAISGDMILADKGEDDKGFVLDIMKGAMEVPKPSLPPPVISIVKQPKAVFINPSHPLSASGFQSTLNPDHCARCGFRWYDRHVCADLVQDSVRGSSFERWRKEQIDKRKRKP
jgi:ATP-dependent Clp protease ATP-binding subunit ClpB